MTKYLILVGQLFLVACGKGGGGVNDPVTGNPPSLAPTCKAFKSAWQSKVDSERHDFTNVNLQIISNATPLVWSNYSYLGYNGPACPYPGQPLKIQVYEANAPTISAGYHYIIEFQNDNPGVGCDNWQDGSTGKHGSALVKVECNKITMCRTIAGLGCKEFN